MVDRFERFSMAISEIYRYWHKIAGEEMAKYGLKGPHCIYLITMARYPEGVTASQLGDACSKDKSDVSRMMSIMEQKGLVVKEGGFQNRYRGVFKLTQSGASAAKFVKKRADLAVELAGKDLTEDSRSLFYSTLDSIVEQLHTLSTEGLPGERESGETLC